MIVFIRTILLYAAIVFALRVMGKRQLGQLQPSEFVITILISNIATLPIEDANIPLVAGIIPILTLVSFDIIMSSITLKSKSARRIVSGSPIMIIKDGVIDQNQMRNLRFSIDDLMEQLRVQGIFDIEEVDFAIVETTGSLSVYKKFDAQEVTAKMLKLSAEGEANAPPVIVISDGAVIEGSLHYCRAGQAWLSQVLEKSGYQVQDIFIMTCNRQKKYHIIPKQ